MHLIILVVMLNTILIVWFLAVVGFFVLWAVLAKVIQRISERRQKEKTALEKTDDVPSIPKDVEPPQ